MEDKQKEAYIRAIALLTTIIPDVVITPDDPEHMAQIVVDRFYSQNVYGPPKGTGSVNVGTPPTINPYPMPRQGLMGGSTVNPYPTAQTTESPSVLELLDVAGKEFESLCIQIGIMQDKLDPFMTPENTSNAGMIGPAIARPQSHISTTIRDLIDRIVSARQRLQSMAGRIER